MESVPGYSEGQGPDLVGDIERLFELEFDSSIEEFGRWFEEYRKNGQPARAKQRFGALARAGELPALSEYLAHLSSEEEAAFFETAGFFGGRWCTSLALPDALGLRWRQLRALLSQQREFKTRHPEAHKILFAPPYPPDKEEVGDVFLPSFGIRVMRCSPRGHAPMAMEPEDSDDACTEIASPSDSLDASSLTDDPEGMAFVRSSLVDQGFLPPERSILRGVLLAIMSREEYQPRYSPFLADGHALKDTVEFGKAPIRITDLRLAMGIQAGTLRRSLTSILDGVERPFTADGVIRWKNFVLKNALEGGSEPVNQNFGDELSGVEAISFASASLLLFLDLGMPNVSEEASYRLAGHIETLAEVIRRLMLDMDRGINAIERLLANRKPGHQARVGFASYAALIQYRMGLPLDEVAKVLEIEPYSSKTGKGTRNWKTRVRRVLDQGKEIEAERFPRAATIFSNSDNPFVRDKACRAYRAYRDRWPMPKPGFLLLHFVDHWHWQDAGEEIRVNYRTQRGLEAVIGYVQLGSCLENGIPFL